MPCPYCRSRKKAFEYTSMMYDVAGEYIAIDYVECGKCGEYYAKMIRENLQTGQRKVICNRCSRPTDIPPEGTVCGRRRGILASLLRRR